ncbi:MarR family transcriptional regulator [Salibacter sp.]|uniref:MarR family winged helix-turn-helix transcriptional regulator n=1 Tax=Salibacter sp. TaxID=2010995 RepID=UPI00286FBD7D|nr:MarR family transcriptional regulator [Salibacter sp.]MDR9398097.1 MarR family transcriptional regulator [Salibacter sp.]MDR9487275.1 MarR family transcriptional regulator [Salibacter sp.]
MDAKDIILNIRKIVRSINLESKRIQKEFGVSIPQLLTLVYLNEQEEFKARQSEIKKYLNLNASTVTGLIYRLEAKGYVAKLPKTGDRRVTYVSITTKGKYIIENSPGLLHTELRDKLENMSPDQFEEVKKASNLLVNVLGAKDVSASPVITEHEPINFQ